MSYSAASLAWARREADRPYANAQYAAAMRELAGVRVDRAAEPVAPYMADRYLCDLAERRAELMAGRITADTTPRDADGYLDWLNEQLDQLDGRRLAFTADRPQGEQLEGIIARVRCPIWWRRSLRRAVVRKREGQAIARSEVCARRRQPYCTNDTLERRQQANARNAAILESVELENDQGDVLTLAECAASSVANKAIRRGELMTRITGCEAIADAAGMVGLFTTNTAPSRFHSTGFDGTPNPKFHGALGPVQPNSPRDAQKWLCRTWARARAALDRAGVTLFGFRVAEPHHDGCPHWHMLIWTHPAQAAQAEAIIRRYWLAENGAEAGAQEHRFKAKRMDRGGAAGYIAKYIAKNIDDAGAVAAEGHRDEHTYGLEQPAQLDLVSATAKRVEAWASAWGIRQFQPLGQPPVTVWRELRRITAEAIEGATERIREAWLAVHRDGDKRACWATYVRQQGGVAMGRCYAIRIAARREAVQGRYETTERDKPMGVLDLIERPDEWVLSNRREWRPRGAWRPEERAAKPARVFPWTRFNNCTQPKQRTVFEWPAETGQPIAGDVPAAFLVKAEALRSIRWSTDDPSDTPASALTA